MFTSVANHLSSGIISEKERKLNTVTKIKIF